MDDIDLLLFGFTFCFCGFIFFSWKLKYFYRRNIPFIKSYPIIGSLGPVLMGKVSLPERITHLYNQLKGHRFGGVFEYMKPLILIRDPVLIKLIIEKDFEYFVERNVEVTEETDSLFEKSIYFLGEKRWRDVRSAVSPAFAPSRMKQMLPLILQTGEQLSAYLRETCKITKNGANKIKTLEIKDLFTRYTSNVIATAVFGIQSNSLQELNNEFFRSGRTITTYNIKQVLVRIGYKMSVRMMKYFEIPLFDTDAKTFFRSLVLDTMSTREKEGIVRPDMIHLLMQARKGELKAETPETDIFLHKIKYTTPALTSEDIIAQSLTFLLAGLQSTSTLLSFCSYLLAANQQIQENVRLEVDAVMEEEGHQLTHESLQRMKYLDMVISETLRLYPPVDHVERTCVMKYTVPACNSSPGMTIEKGEGLWIPVQGLHLDPEYFPDPEKFDPERFSDSNKQHIKPFTYLPFGIGPRNCIGMHFAMMTLKVALSTLLATFSLHVVPATPPLRLARGSFIVQAEGDLWIGVLPRCKQSPGNGTDSL